MKLKYYLSFLGGVSLSIDGGQLWGGTNASSAISIATGNTGFVQKEEHLAENATSNTNVELWEDPFAVKGSNTTSGTIDNTGFEQGEDPFGTISVSQDEVFDKNSQKVFNNEALGSANSTPAIALKATGNIVASGNKKAMLLINGSNIKVNSEQYSNALVVDILNLVEYLYLATKRYNEENRVYPGAFLRETHLARPPLYETLKSKNIEIFAPIYGTNGGREGAYIGMLAYRRVPGHLELFVVLEGSQGEPFEFLGGIGGASWRTNFQSNKVSVDAQKLNLNKKYGKLSFHEGYYNKIYTSKIFFEEKLQDLFKTLGIKSFSEYKAQKSENITQKDIDNWRGFSVDVYIFGHSQGGGLTQIGAPYVTTTVGRMLYGDSFDNKTFNVCHAICMSPARAIGDEHTMNVIMEIMGKGNIFGWCSPLDLVPCLPLGDNINQRPLEKFRATVMLKILGLISRFLPKKWSDLVSVVSETKVGYATLPIFAYVDYGNLLENYCGTGIKVNQEYLDILKRNGAKGDTKTIQKTVEDLKKLKKSIPELRKIVTSMQENYFKAHTSNWLSSKYYAVKAVYFVTKLLGIIALSDLIASQHWGAPVLLKNPNSDKNVWVETLFFSKLLSSTLQEDLDRGVAYNITKERIINNG